MRKKIIAALSLLAISGVCFAVKPLLVCTAGDYPPLTYQDAKTKQYFGFAISVAKQLAKKMKTSVQFVKTSWPQLDAFLESGKCDIAMGGITKTKAREKIFYTSVPVLFGRKAAVFSKANAKRFTSFKEINQPGVTVIENLGGTNALYAKANISKAQLVVVKKNADIFTCLLKNPEKPWLMLTDNIEVSFRTKQSQGMLSAAGLEIALPNNPMTEKVYLLPKTAEGKKLLGVVNKLVKSLQSSHQLFSIYQQTLAAKYDLPAATCPLTREGK